MSSGRELGLQDVALSVEHGLLGRPQAYFQHIRLLLFSVAYSTGSNQQRPFSLVGIDLILHETHKAIYSLPISHNKRLNRVHLFYTCQALRRDDAFDMV